MHQTEGRAGYVSVGRDIKTCSYKLGKGCLAGAKGAVKDNYITRSGNFTQNSAESFRLSKRPQLDRKFSAIHGLLGLHVFLVAEQAAIFGRMAIRKRGLTLRIVAFLTRFFGLFFCHFMEMLMGLVMGESNRGLFRGIPQEKEKAST
jgi:hypothetical protein